MEFSALSKPMPSFPSIRLLSSLWLLDSEKLLYAKIRTILKLSMIIRLFKVSMLIFHRTEQRSRISLQI